MRFYFFLKLETSAIHCIIVLTEAEPRGQLAERSLVWVIAQGAEQFEANINEGLQHGHPSFCTWLSPLRLSYCSVNLQGGQGFVPVYRLRGGEKKNTTEKTTFMNRLKPVNGMSKEKSFSFIYINNQI